RLSRTTLPQLAVQITGRDADKASQIDVEDPSHNEGSRYTSAQVKCWSISECGTEPNSSTLSGQRPATSAWHSSAPTRRNIASRFRARAALMRYGLALLRPTPPTVNMRNGPEWLSRGAHLKR